MAFAHHITVPIMTPTETSHSDLPTPTEETNQQQAAEYDAGRENHAAHSILSDLDGLPNYASTSSAPLSQTQLDTIKAEAQSVIDTQKFTTKKGFKNWLDEEMAVLVQDAEQRAKKRSEAMRANENVEEEIRKLEARYETEMRALKKRMGQP